MFDIHSDLLYDLYTQSKKGVKNRFIEKHVVQMQQSNIQAALWTMYSPDDFDLREAIQIALQEIDIVKIPSFSYMLGFEGLRNLKKIEDLDWFVEQGFCHAMLTWNEENSYATGVAGDPNRGLTDEGRKLIDRMMAHDMIIDVAHLNEKSFYDVLEYAPKNIIYSHGNVKELCNHRRNLTTDQMIRLRERDGLFGLTLAKNFVSSKEEEKNLEHFLHHLDRAVEIMGIDLVCFGFDFMDYLDEDFPNSNIHEVPDATRVHLILEGMRDRGYSEVEISKICYDNFFDRFGSKLKYKGDE